MVKINFLVIGILLVILLGFVSSLGCCVSSNQAICSPNSEKASCEQFGGTYFDHDLSCSQQRVCDSGCCILGVDSSRMTQGQCRFESISRGFSSMNFLQTSLDCNKYTVSQDWGSCISLNSFGKKACKFIARTSCAGEFFSGVLCSSVENSGCNKTENTLCFGNGVYYTDTCGNRDALAEECNSNAGEVCSSEGSNANCVDASCNDNFDYSNFVIQELYKTIPVFSPVKRNQGDTWCVTNGNVPFVDDELERDLNKLSDTISTVAGLKFFSRYCIGGKIITEECSDGKEAYCSGSSSVDVLITRGTGGKCTGNEWRDCLSAENEADCDTAYCYWFSPEVKSINQSSFEILEIEKCLPKVAGGIRDSASSSTVCSMGDFSASLSSKGLALVASPKNKFVLLNPEVIAFLDYRCSRIADCTGKLSWVGDYGRNSSNGVEYYNSDEVHEQISTRDISFANGKSSGVETIQVLNNYLSGAHPSLSYLEEYDLGSYPKDKFPVIFGQNEQDTFEYTCAPRKAPSGGECQKCNSAGSVCTKYSCEAIGKNCEFMSSGTCESKADLTSPTFTVNCPDSSTIGIQQPVNISVSTSETSYCRFSIGSALASYDLMPYDLGNTWGSQHKGILSVPGSNAVAVGNATQYPLLLKSGKYNVFIRCIDGRGNGDTDPAQVCTFDVPRTPDKNPPVILKFTPATNTPIIFNTTTQKIQMLVNEPVECKWSLKDEAYDTMLNKFNCSSTLKVSTTISGYSCDAVLQNVTKNIGNSTSFYIRCKDQPYLVTKEEISAYLKSEGYSDGEILNVVNGAYSVSQISSFMQTDGYSEEEIEWFLEKLANMETSTYSRNTNDKSTVYSLKASKKLEISEVSPKNRVMLGPNFADWNLTVRTVGGGYEGITECKWKLDYKNASSAYSSFSATQSTFKSQVINQKIEGDYLLSVICADDSGNTANYSGPLEVRYDRVSPGISRVYNDKGNLKVITTEPAMCKYTSASSLGIGCAFSISNPNLTSMQGVTATEHTTPWKKGSSYFVKCRDFYGNENSICSTVAKAV